MFTEYIFYKFYFRNTINLLIFQLTDDPYRTCMMLIQKCFILMKNNEHSK